jgi:hypothetical protein
VTIPTHFFVAAWNRERTFSGSILPVTLTSPVPINRLVLSTPAAHTNRCCDMCECFLCFFSPFPFMKLQQILYIPFNKSIKEPKG